MIEFEVRHWITNNENGINPGAPVSGSGAGAPMIAGNIFYGSKGYLEIDGNYRDPNLHGPGAGARTGIDRHLRRHSPTSSPQSAAASAGA